MQKLKLLAEYMGNRKKRDSLPTKGRVFSFEAPFKYEWDVKEKDKNG